MPLSSASQPMLKRTTDPRKLGGYFVVQETFITGGDTRVELWERQHDDFLFYYWAWFAFDDVVRVAQIVILDGIVYHKFLRTAREGIKENFQDLCKSQYELGSQVVNILLDMGDKLMDMHERIGVERFEEQAYYEDDEDIYGSISSEGYTPTKTLPSEQDVFNVDEVNGVFEDYIEGMEELDDPEDTDTRTSDEDDGGTG